MESNSDEKASELTSLLVRARDGDVEAREELLSQYRRPLKSMIKMRLNRQLQGRMDDSDILQDVFLEAHRRLDSYLQAPQASFLLWIRRIANDKLLEVHRNHLKTQRRAAHREVSLNRAELPMASSYSIAAQLLGMVTPPTEAVLRAELQSKLRESLNELSPLDREILSLRHFEDLSNVEAAQELGLEASAASKRYLRALSRVRVIMERHGLI